MSRVPDLFRFPDELSLSRWKDERSGPDLVAIIAPRQQAGRHRPGVAPSVATGRAGERSFEVIGELEEVDGLEAPASLASDVPLPGIARLILHPPRAAPMAWQIPSAVDRPTLSARTAGRGARIDTQVAVYADSVVRQRDDLPALYGDVDFTVVPERFDREADIDDMRFEGIRGAVRRVFHRPALMETIRNSTMTGDRVADAYATLIPEVGFRALVDMLDTACDRGRGGSSGRLSARGDQRRVELGDLGRSPAGPPMLAGRPARLRAERADRHPPARCRCVRGHPLLRPPVQGHECDAIASGVVPADAGW